MALLTSPEAGCEGRLRYDAFYVNWDAKARLNQTPVADDHGRQRNENSHRGPDRVVGRIESGVAEQGAGQLLVVEAAAAGWNDDVEAEQAARGPRLVAPEARKVHRQRADPDATDGDACSSLVDEAASVQRMADGDVATDGHHYRQPRATYSHTSRDRVLFPIS